MSAAAGAGPGNEVNRLRILYQLLAAMNRASGVAEIQDAALTSLMEAVDVDRAAILLFESDGVMRFQASRGLSPEYCAAVTGHSPWGQGEREALPIAISDVLRDDRVAPFRDALQREGIGALAFVPLAAPCGVIGKFMLYYNEPHACTPDELQIAQAIAAHVSLATEHKRADMARRHLAALVASSDDAIISKSLNGIITSWNGGAQRIFGYTAEEAIGRPVTMLAAPERLNEMPQILGILQEGKRVDHYETRRRTKDGRIIDVALTVSPIYDASGAVVGASKIARDITEKKQEENERALLLAREQEARRTAELLNRVGPRLVAQLDSAKLVQEVIDMATVLVDAQFGSFFRNVVDDTGAARIEYSFSASPREMPAAAFHPSEIAVLPLLRGEGGVRCRDALQEGRPEGEAPARSYLATPVVTRSGEVLGGLFFGHSLPDHFTDTHESIVTGIAAQMAIALDNARLFEQAEWSRGELSRSNDELRRANRDLEVFAYSASHDLQEPLRTISISAQLIERGGALTSEDDAVFLGNILTAARRMTDLLGDLRVYTEATRYERGSAPATEPACVIQAVIGNLGAMVQEAEATVTAGELPKVSMHENRLSQVLQNLIGNAIKYRGQQPPHIHVSAEEKDGWYVFSVADNGIGIDPEFRETIFGLFKRLHSRDEIPGSGVGLAICQRIVEQYGGRIWLDSSEPGKGSTFCFSIPVRPAPKT